MQASELSRKLRIGPGDRCLVFNPPDGYLDRLRPLPEGASATSGNGAEAADLVQLFVADRAALEQKFAAGFRALKPGGLLWVSYPNAASSRATDLSRNHGWGVLHGAGLTATDEISVDGSWEALRFQPSAQVERGVVPGADMLPVGREASPVFRAVRVVARALFRLLFRFDVQGLATIPDRAYVLIGNHLGWMDAISLLLLFRPEPRIHYLADPTSMMKNRPLWALVRAVGGIVPVDRMQRGNTLLFRHVQRCLETGGVVAVFPEGDFGPSEGQLLPFKKGFAHFAVSAGVPVVPVALAGMKEIWVGKRLFVRIGAAIPTTGKTVDEVHQLGRDAVTALLPTYHEPSGPKPLRRWLTDLF
ncbi:MAG: 1-acyl-sn-glycerol-3-phosphate acyltransferase [Chloroflexi bacterium]|nr:MAG: 1-acyl-sn-glycerol-3-phosphate acyltransferase [Chloroflexota bacterium]